MGKQFGNNRGLKRPNKTQKFESTRHTKKNRCVEQEKIAHLASPSSSGELSEEETGNVAPTEEIIHKESSTYDELLKLLSSSSKSVAHANKQRQRQEEGISDTEEDEDDETSSLPEEVDDDAKEIDNESLKSDKLQNGRIAGVDKQTEDEIETSGLDEEHDSGIDDESAVEATVSDSAFSRHVGHILSKVEVDNLSTMKWKYKWEVPAIGMSNSRWVGTGECFLKDLDTNLNIDYDMKLKLYKHWLDLYKTSGKNDFHSSKQRLFFTLCNSYRDILHCNKKPFYLKGLEDDSSVMDGYIMHSLNHVFKTRDIVTKNDSKVAKDREKSKDELPNDDSFLDQGFTRPKVLILLPLASIALRVVKRLIQLTPSSHRATVEHMDRFSKEFDNEDVEDSEDENKESGSGQDFGNLNSQKSSKPSDFDSLFGGINNDHFVFGIKFTRRSIKLYSDFYSSDIIVASALGLLTVLIIDYAEVIAMQNWSYLSSVVKQLNLIPSKQHGTDVMRIRQWYLDGYARFYRQTIMLSSYLNPDINAMFNHQCLNYQGKVKLECECKGVLPKVVLQVQQIYQRFGADTVVDIDDARLEYFMKKVFPKIKDSVQGGVMIFISSYFEFVRIRNFLKSQNASFCLLSEYTKQSDISRARVWFFEGKRKIMLYTERMHFYHRYKIRGIKNLLFYSLPERKEFYPEIVNMVEGSDNLTSTTLFSRFDQLRLERIVGTANAKRMVKSEKEVFVFC
ncbi:protein NUCLEOLAR FACTOR 1 isoform X2 [Humulus lupulus]|uniref:protein NUCLEOLAR FACTOR 1 isoform X2 n=1 Tax=Humulus lupulus TaxID=3486 RepID=UPI002B40A8E6|nr:protein NUCLEOLAR FACTOR 1 isoform X2 [Humulus lupulus]